MKKLGVNYLKKHYEKFLEQLKNEKSNLNDYILEQLGDIRGKKVIHLQCNTGHDTILLAKLGATVTGVDLAEDNIYYAKKMAKELGYENINFIASDVLKLTDIHNEKYDIVFTSEGVLGWLPDLTKWAKVVKTLLNDNGFFYIFDSHPFYMTMDETKLDKGIFDMKYPYFGGQPDIEDTIGGYAAEPKENVEAYFWTHKISDIINPLIREGLQIEYFNEYLENFWNPGNMKKSEKEGLFEYEFNKDLLPMSYSLKATVTKKDD